MKKFVNINPLGLKGNEINERIKGLMGLTAINENRKNSAIELTKKGPDGNVYAIIRENHEYFIKKSTKRNNLTLEDFHYIGGLQNKHQEGYQSYEKATKHLNLKFLSLKEAHNSIGDFNVLEDDNLLENTVTGFSSMKGNGFSGEGNLDGNKELNVEGTETEDEDEEKLTEVEQAVEDMATESEEVETKIPVKENKLRIMSNIENMDTIIESLGKTKKKVLTLR